MDIQKIDIRAVYLIRNIAHLVGTLMVLLIIGLTLKEFQNNSYKEDIPALIFFLSLFVMLAGFITAWRKEKTGGILILSGFILFVFESFIITTRYSFGYIFTLIPFTGFAYLFCCRFKILKKKSAIKKR